MSRWPGRSRQTPRRLTAQRLAPVDRRVALGAAEVPEVYGRGDPGDCFLIATARVRRLPIVTRDGTMRELAAGRPACLTVVACRGDGDRGGRGAKDRGSFRGRGGRPHGLGV